MNQHKATKPYPTYKSSSIEWLGDMPDRWTIEKGKWLFIKMDRPVRAEDEVVTCFRDGTVTLRRNRRTSGFTESLKEIGYQGIRKGDLVIHAMDGSAGAIGVSDSDGKGSPVYSVCTPKPHSDPYYFAYLLREMARRGWIQALAKGIRERSTDFRYSEFAQQHLPLPPLAEQRAIAKYLDYIDRRIQRYIEAKERLIGLLEEQKRAVINQAVTRGLDPDVPLKASGVEWLGDVPAHWEVRRLHTIANVTPSNVDKHVNEDETVVQLCNYVDVYKNDEIDGALPFMTATAKTVEIEKFQLKCDDVLVTKDSETWDDIGVPALVAESLPNVLCGYHLAVLRPKPMMLGGFMAWSIRSDPVAYQFHVVAKGVTRYGISRAGLQSIRVPIPPIEEQRRIFDYVKSFAKGVESSTANAIRQIELIKEYRTRLVADVVTGKLDVREAVAELPDEEEMVRSGDQHDFELAEVG